MSAETDYLTSFLPSAGPLPSVSSKKRFSSEELRAHE